jgi:SagB-type dehydrogenase family enzyme
MPKALWVSLPIALFFAVVLALALARRPLGRLALNVLSSLLLLAYVAITAGLGVFWVANQQLPAFDWHYLFGYGTVLLLCVHLAFNLRLVLAFFRRRSRAPAAEPQRGRAPIGWMALAALGMLGAFAMGVRHGKVEVRVGAGAPAAGAWAAVADEYHALSSHSRFSVLSRAPSVDWGDAPPPKTYPGAPRIALPAPAAPAQPRSVSEAMRGPSGVRSAPLDLGTLASILHHTSGVTHGRGGFELRASPSSGALFPAEVYVAVRASAGAPPGLYHFDAPSPALERIADAPSAAALGVGRAALADAPAVAFVTAVLRRTGQKYRDRAYRYAAADIGHLLENLAIAAAEHGLSAEPLPAFDDAAAARALGIDGATEVVLAVVPLAARPAGTFATAEGLAYRPFDISATPTLGVTSAVHAATSLRLSPPLAASEVLPAGPALPLAPPTPAPDTALGAIAARESRRTYAPSPLPLLDLGALLQNATAVPQRLSAAVSVHVIANRVSGLAPGAYLLSEEASALVPLRTGDLREEAFSASLSQDVIGNAAAVIVLAIDRDRALAEGPRGYRHAYLEVGMLGERILLEATARGLGNCPVGAFYDDDAAALIGVGSARTWVAHLVALGALPR